MIASSTTITGRDIAPAPGGPCRCLAAFGSSALHRASIPASRQPFSAASVGRRQREQQLSSCRQKRQRPHGLHCRAEAAAADACPVPDGSVSLVLLAGGVGKRMGAAIPKQYLEILGQPIATYSLQTFASMREVGEIVVVCEEDYRAVFNDALNNLPEAARKPLKFAKPGKERQDSVHSGFQTISASALLVAIHDSARPLVTAEDTSRCLRDAMQVGAAVLGVPVKPTIKEVDASGRVVKTLQRSALVEVQTPQAIRPELLRAGFELVERQGLEVTDDVSIIEALGEPVQITTGAYSNIKVTTPDDMSVAEGFLKEHRSKAVVHA